MGFRVLGLGFGDFYLVFLQRAVTKLFKQVLYRFRGLLFALYCDIGSRVSQKVVGLTRGIRVKGIWDTESRV